MSRYIPSEGRNRNKHSVDALPDPTNSTQESNPEDVLYDNMQ